MNQVYAFTELKAYVINQIHTGSTFAVNEADSSEQIFIPSQIARVQNIVPGDRVSVRAIPNKHNGGAKWFAVFAAPIPAVITPQIDVARLAPTPEAMIEANIMEALEAWEAKESTPAPAPAPAPAPKRETAADVRIRANDVLNTGGMWSFSDLRDKLWPDTDFGSGDYRYKLLANVLRDLHEAAEVAVVGRRHSADGILTGMYYTKTPGNVRFVWEE